MQHANGATTRPHSTLYASKHGRAYEGLEALLDRINDNTTVEAILRLSISNGGIRNVEIQFKELVK